MRSLLTVAILSTTLITAGCDAAEPTSKQVVTAPTVVVTAEKPTKKPVCVLKSVDDAKRFQKENGLVVDGKVGPKTKALMAKKGCLWAPQALKNDPKWQNNSLRKLVK